MGEGVANPIVPSTRLWIMCNPVINVSPRITYYVKEKSNSKHIQQTVEYQTTTLLRHYGEGIQSIQKVESIQRLHQRKIEDLASPMRVSWSIHKHHPKCSVTERESGDRNAVS